MVSTSTNFITNVGKWLSLLSPKKNLKVFHNLAQAFAAGLVLLRIFSFPATFLTFCIAKDTVSLLRDTVSSFAGLFCTAPFAFNTAAFQNFFEVLKSVSERGKILF